MRKKLNLLLAIVLVVAFGVIFLVGCGDNLGQDNGGKDDVGQDVDNGGIAAETYTNFDKNLVENATLKMSDGTRRFGDDTRSITGYIGGYIDVLFDEMTKVNAIELVEAAKGDYANNVNLFRIFYRDVKTGEFKFIYEQDIIEIYRYCTFTMVETDAIRIKMVSTKRDSSWEISSVKAYKAGKTHNDDFRVSAYMTSETIQDPDSISVEHMKTINYVHMYCASFNIKGEVYLRNYTREWDNQYIDGTIYFEKALANIRAKMQPGTKIILSFLPDGAGLTTSQMCVGAMRDHKEDLAKNMMLFLKKYDLDGGAFDWEYPESKEEWRIFFDFCRYFQERKTDEILSAAIGSWFLKIGQLNYNDLDVLDIIELMTYDTIDANGFHSAFFNACYEPIAHMDIATTIFKLPNLAKKVNIGLPYYSRPLDCAAYWGDYRNVAEELGKYTNLYKGDVYMNGELLKYNYYNSYQMIYDKTAYTMDKGLGGVMIWQYVCDLPGTHPLSLTNAITEAIASRS